MDLKQVNKKNKTIKRRDLLKFLSLQPILLKESVSKQTLHFNIQTKTKRPLNFIFILTDDLGWGDLGCYGNKNAITPNLDRLAKEGVQFNNFYVNSPVCSPSRAAFLTGLFPGRIGLHTVMRDAAKNLSKGMPASLDPKIPSLIALLKQAGYFMGHFGKWHLGNRNISEYGFHNKGISLGSINANDNLDFNNSTKAIIDLARIFIRTNRNKPFYLNLWMFDPHAPLEPTEDQMKYTNNYIMKRLIGKFTSPAQVYYSVIRELDYQIGRLIKTLDNYNLSENTMIIFSSDNGPEDISVLETAHSGVGSTGPFRGRKRSLYEGGIRTPLIVRCPSVLPSGKINNTTILSAIDLLPTLCSFANVKVPDNVKIDGEDMSKAFKGDEIQRTKPLFWENRFQIIGPPINKSPMLAVREGKWKLLMNPDKTRIELYDITNDPMEVDNLTENNTSVVSRLSDKLLSWSKELPKGPVHEKAGSNEFTWPGKSIK